MMRARFLSLLFTGLLLFLSVCDRPVAAQTLFATANVSPQLIPQPLLQAVEQTKGGIVTCTIARSIDVYEQPSATSKRTATVEKRSEQTQLVLADGNGNEPWLHVAQVNYSPGISQPLSGYVLNDLKAAPQQSLNGIVGCVASQQNSPVFKAASPVQRFAAGARSSSSTVFPNSGNPQHRR